MHVNVRAYMHMNVRACMRTCVRTCLCATSSCDPLYAPSRGWARPQNCTGFEYQQLCTSILGLYSRCTIISAQVDCTNYHQRQNKTSRIVRPSARPPARSCGRRSSTRSPACSPLRSPPPLTPRAVFNISAAASF